MATKSPKDKALRLLSVRDRTEEELRQRLIRDGFEADETEATLTWLRELGYVDDNRTAKRLVEHHNRFRPLGQRGLKQQLRLKGIATEIVEEVLNSSEDDYNMAVALAEKRVGSLVRLSSDKQKRRLASFLERRGFSWEIIRRVINQVLGESLDTNG